MTSPFDEIATRCHGDWRALMRIGANVLVTLPRELFDAFGESCRGTFREPVACVRGGSALRVEGIKTLIIVDLQLLTIDDQHTLAAWMSDAANADTQIIGLTHENLFRLVQDGQFDRDLYYRLNTIHLDVIGLDGDR